MAREINLDIRDVLKHGPNWLAELSEESLLIIRDKLEIEAEAVAEDFIQTWLEHATRQDIDIMLKKPVE